MIRRWEGALLFSERSESDAICFSTFSVQWGGVKRSSGVLHYSADIYIYNYFSFSFFVVCFISVVCSSGSVWLFFSFVVVVDHDHVVRLMEGTTVDFVLMERQFFNSFVMVFVLEAFLRF